MEAVSRAGAATPPAVLRRPRDAAALVGGRVLLKVAYAGHPEPTVKWTRAGKELKNDERTSITCDDGVSCLLLQDITTDVSGKYDICVENALGSDCTFASVSVEGPPDPPSGKPSVSANRNSATVAWSSSPYDGGKIVIGYAVEYSLVGSEIWTEAIDNCYSLSYDVGGLVPGARYVFRIFAINEHGRSKPSRESDTVLLEEESQTPAAFEPRIVGLEPESDFKSRFHVEEELGKGRFGVVHKVFDIVSSQKLAAKFIKCRTSKDREKVKDEIEIMNLLRHPKLLQLAAAYESAKDIIMVTEYISGGELFERVVADDFTLTEKDCILFMRQICEGVAYMHTQNIVHLDLKPENIMCHTRTSHEIKIIDFGLAQKLNPDTPMRVLFGTPEFIPPEIINYEPIGTESDIWSLGVICYVLLSGLSPFMGDNDAETFANITRADYDFEDEAFNAVSQNARNFISALLVKRREDRLSAEQCLKHIWLDPDSHKETVILSTDKLKKFIIRRKWQKTGNAIRALGRMATLSASRRNSANSTPNTPRPSISGTSINALEMLNEEESPLENNNEGIATKLMAEINELKAQIEDSTFDNEAGKVAEPVIRTKENGLSEDVDKPKPKEIVKSPSSTITIQCTASAILDSKITNNSVKLGDAITKLNRAAVKCTSPSSTGSLQRLPIYSSRSVAKTIKKFSNNEQSSTRSGPAPSPTTERGRKPATNNNNKCDKLSVTNGENNCKGVTAFSKSTVESKSVTKSSNKLVPSNNISISNNNSIKPPSTVRYRSPSPSLLRKTQAVIAKEQCNKHVHSDNNKVVISKNSPTSNNKKVSQSNNNYNKAPIANKKEKFQSTVAFWNSQKT